MDKHTAIDAESTGGAPVSHPSELATVPLGDTAARQHVASRTLWGDAWYRLRRNKLALAALAYLFVVSLMAVTADLWVPRIWGDVFFFNSQSILQERFQDPSLEHPMGTDNFGRDVFGRIVYGARVSLAVGLIATTISLIIGLLMGAFSGYYGGLVDSGVMRLTDIFLAFPYLLFAILLISVLGQGVTSLVIAIAVLGWTTIARVFRSSVLSVKENEYVEAARAMGAGNLRIMARHIMPNAMAPIIVYGTMSIGGVILSEAALSFLGLGVQPPTPSWGRMLNEAQKYVVSHPLLFIWPGLAIVATVLAFVLLGDGLRDALDVKLTE